MSREDRPSMQRKNGSYPASERGRGQAIGRKGYNMKRICITYHMTKTNEVAETCVTISVADDVADDILENQGDSQYVRQGSFSITAIKTILSNLAELQGYADAAFCMAEEDPF